MHFSYRDLSTAMLKTNAMCHVHNTSCTVCNYSKENQETDKTRNWRHVVPAPSLTASRTSDLNQ